jgi:antitoxin VapB
MKKEVFLGRSMALNIKDDEVDRLARQLSKRTGETITDAVRTALKEKLARLAEAKEAPLSERLIELGRRTAALPRLTDKTSKELVEELYDEHGLPR